MEVAEVEANRRKERRGALRCAEGARVPCPHFPRCAGCALLGRPYGEQLEEKRAAVQRAFEPYPELRGIPVPPVIGSPRVFGYRTTAKLAVRRSRGAVRVGIYRPGTHQVVDIRDCPVHHPLIHRVVCAVAERLEGSPITVYDERAGGGWLRYLVVRASTWQKKAQLVLVVTRPGNARERQWARSIAARLPFLAGVVENVNAAPGNAIFGAQFIPRSGQPAMSERIGGLRLKTRSGAFLQANPQVAARLYRCAAQLADVGEEEIVADLYSGVGALAFHLAPAARLVVGIEEAPAAALAARENARLNGFSNIRFRLAPVEAELPKLRRALGRIDVVALNPPRSGASEAAREAIAACEARRIVYISCSSASLARDLAWLATRGYRVCALQPFDMLPQTDHVELLAALERVAPGGPPG